MHDQKYVLPVKIRGMSHVHAKGGCACHMYMATSMTVHGHIRTSSVPCVEPTICYPIQPCRRPRRWRSNPNPNSNPHPRFLRLPSSSFACLRMPPHASACITRSFTPSRLNAERQAFTEQRQRLRALEQSSDGAAGSDKPVDRGDGVASDDKLQHQARQRWEAER